jgi:hypothetical protein
MEVYTTEKNMRCNSMKKATEELLNELKEAKAITDFTSANAEEFEMLSLDEILLQMLEKYKKAKIDVIKAARFDYTYGYQIFDGRKKPRRDKLLQLAFGFPLTVDETNVLLRAGGMNSLYVRNRRDAICMYCLQQRKSVDDCNDMLFESGEETF